MKVYFILVAFIFVSGFVKADSAENKKIVTAFYKMAFIDHQAQAAADLYFGEKYTQHNPHVPDGKKAFTDYFVPFFKTHPGVRAEIKQVAAEGDLVFLHVYSHGGKSDPKRAIVDIFRVENAKIVEHWDVIQEVPEKSANLNSMF